jgi:hypothetical protein
LPQTAGACVVVVVDVLLEDVEVDELEVLLVVDVEPPMVDVVVDEVDVVVVVSPGQRLQSRAWQAPGPVMTHWRQL